jgi:hypothetical protein
MEAAKTSETVVKLLPDYTTLQKTAIFVLRCENLRSYRGVCPAIALTNSISSLA